MTWAMRQALLRHIGDQLDQQVVVKVGCGGVVMPGDGIAISSSSGEVSTNGNERSRGSAARPRQGSAGRQGASRGPGTPGAYSSFGGTDPGPNPAPDEVAAAYPGAAVWPQPGGFWLLSDAVLLRGEYRRARFATAVCTKTASTRAWAFWVTDLSRTVAIGPRHTYLDGSVCAVGPTDAVWSFGDSLVGLLDLQTLWAFRHLHLERVGRWPGPQIAFDYFERMVECRPTEICGCPEPKGTYEQCCMAADAGRDRIAALMRYRAFYGDRFPPEEVVRFVNGDAPPPPIPNLLPARMSDIERAWDGLSRRSDGVPLPVRSVP